MSHEASPAIWNRSVLPVTRHSERASLQHLRRGKPILDLPTPKKWCSLVFGMMDGSNKRGRPHREWSDDIEQWRGATLQELSHAALDKQRWAAIVTMASDTNGH